jgi:predicted permease
MELQNEVGTAGIIIASVFSALILICACTLITMCYRDKSKQRRQEEMRRVKSVKIAERAALLQRAQ